MTRRQSYRAVIALAAFAVALAGCKDKSASPATSSSTAMPSSPPLAQKEFYRVDAGPPSPCTAGSTCEARVVLTALGDYHVNKEYPFKFVADPAAVATEGDGTIAFDGEKSATLTVKFKPTAAGTAKLVGTFKLSVCTEKNCEIETPALELSVPVS